MATINCAISIPLDPMRRPRREAVAAVAGGNRRRPMVVELLPPGASGSAEVRLAVHPFRPGTSRLFVNGVRYWVDDDYKELPDGAGFRLEGLAAEDEVYLVAITE